MMAGQFHLDLFGELRNLLGGFEPIVLPSVVRELEGLARSKGRDGAAARFGRALCDGCTIAGEADEPAGTVDEKVIAWAVRNDAIVVTNDRGVRDVLLARGMGVISLRKQKKLELLRR